MLEFDQCQSRELLPLKCECCSTVFYKRKNLIQQYYSECNQQRKHKVTFAFCGKRCSSESQKVRQSYICKQCGVPVSRTKSQSKKVKNIFCSSSCAASYNNSHKTIGTRRSKLECWIEQELTLKHPTMPIDYNKTDAINAELDIYIPSLKLAFELNGIFHYEPVYSDQKFQKTQTNDRRKFQACAERGIELCVIDTSSQSRFSIKSSKKFLDIITSIVSTKLVHPQGIEPCTYAG